MVRTLEGDGLTRLNPYIKSVIQVLAIRSLCHSSFHETVSISDGGLVGPVPSCRV